MIKSVTPHTNTLNTTKEKNKPQSNLCLTYHVHGTTPDFVFAKYYLVFVPVAHFHFSISFYQFQWDVTSSDFPGFQQPLHF